MKVRSLERWRETIAILAAHAPTDEFAPLCEVPIFAILTFFVKESI